MAINKELYFDDLSSFWDFSMRESNAYNKSSRNSADAWNGNLTWEDAKVLAIKGWKEGLSEVEKYRAQITPVITDKVLRATQIYSLAGHSVDVGRFLANDPECFISREFEEKNYPGKIYKIVCSVSFSASVKPETIIQRGGMVCALIDAIEYAGHRAEVIGNDASSNNSLQEYREGKFKDRGWLEISVQIKKAAQPLVMSDLAFCLAHPAMLRRMMFSVAEITGWSDFVTNYGYPAEATDKGDIYIREIYSETVSDDKAVAWVLDELEKLGINIET